MSVDEIYAEMCGGTFPMFSQTNTIRTHFSPIMYRILLEGN